MATPAFVWDSSVNKSILCVYDSVTGLPVFIDETTGLPVDVTDRAARLLGVVYGSQGQKIQQKATTYELATDITTQSLTAVKVSATAAANLVTNPIFVTPTNGTAAAAIDAANTARTTGTIVQAVQGVDAAGAVISTSALATSAKQDLQPLAATTPAIYNIEMTLADTEYSQALPANTKILEFREQSTGFVTRYAFAAGKVAAPTAPYRTLDVGEVKTLDGLNLAAATLYFACSTAGKVMEIEAWT